MTNKSENSQFQIATASTLKAISGDFDKEREIKFSGTSSYLSSKEIRLPQILKELDKEVVINSIKNKWMLVVADLEKIPVNLK